jgi:hypothetical protein
MPDPSDQFQLLHMTRRIERMEMLLNRALANISPDHVLYEQIQEELTNR